MTEESPAALDRQRQRVRARVSVPLVAALMGTPLRTTTLDLSESGAAFTIPANCAAIVGAAFEITLVLGKQRIWLDAEVVRVVDRTRERVISVRFRDASARDEDLIRGHVYAALREARTRSLG